MKSITRWDHLSEFGNVPLTGESCGLGYRMLCDVTAKGKTILEKCFGIPDLRLPDHWNTGSAAEPHVGSIMLAPELLVPIAVLALLESGCKEVWKVGDQGVHGIQFSDPADTAESLKKWLGVDNLRRLAYRGAAGDHNVHLMSGRVQ
jgi:hypothetical protein